eukprot:4390611-Amphidinium_carterae.1
MQKSRVRPCCCLRSRSGGARARRSTSGTARSSPSREREQPETFRGWAWKATAGTRGISSEVVRLTPETYLSASKNLIRAVQKASKS